jgi:hypothetical protein
VRGLERLGNLPRHGQRLVHWDRAAGDPLRQILALDQFHHERTDATGLFQAVDVRNVRVVERRERLRLPREPRQPVWIARERVRQDLHRDVTVQLGVARTPDLAHAAFTDLGGDLIDAYAGASGQGQDGTDYTCDGARCDGASVRGATCGGARWKVARGHSVRGWLHRC